MKHLDSTFHGAKSNTASERPINTPRVKIAPLAIAILAMAFSGNPAVADDTSYVAINGNTASGLVKIASDGSITTIAPGVRGISLIRDRNGDFIVAAVSALLRVTPLGAVSTIANA